MNRRDFIYRASAGAVLLAAGPGVLVPLIAHAADRPVNAFRATIEPDVVAGLFGDAVPHESAAVVVEAPMMGTGASVPVSVKAELEGVDAMAIVVAGNAHPLCALYLPHSGAGPFFNTYIRVDRSSAVTAYVRADGRLWMASTRVKVGIGGYGTGG